MFDQDDDLIMISALEHYSYCPRQCALIHQEQTYDENLYTLRGRAVHKQVDEPEHTVEAGVRVERALALRSYRLGLTGRADVVEFRSARGLKHVVTPWKLAGVDGLGCGAINLCRREAMLKIRQREYKHLPLITGVGSTLVAFLPPPSEEGRPSTTQRRREHQRRTFPYLGKSR